MKKFPYIHKEGTSFITAGLLVSFTMLFINSFLSVTFFIVIAFLLYFFRNPVRVIPKGENIVVSPGDGVVKKISKNTSAPEELQFPKDQKWTRISIFLSIFDVHVTRSPVAGEIKGVVYRTGKFINAAYQDASRVNERNSLVISTKENYSIICVQIAGLIARRIVCYSNRGDLLGTGQEYGFIRFGSRIDVYIPESEHLSLNIVEGQRVTGGETVIAKQ